VAGQPSELEVFIKGSEPVRYASLPEEGAAWPSPDTTTDDAPDTD
jgi:hypothetical protein